MTRRAEALLLKEEDIEPRGQGQDRPGSPESGDPNAAQGPGQDPEVYRYSLLIRIPVLVAASFWGAILVILAMAGEQRLHMYAGACFFVAFFAFFGAMYWLTEIRIGPNGLKYRGPLKALEADWLDVVRINVYEGLVYSWMLTEIQVVTRKGHFSFTPFLSRHRRLIQRIRQLSAQARRRALEEEDQG